jgi:hypothetical protein
MRIPAVRDKKMEKYPIPPMTPHQRKDTSGWMVLVAWPDGQEEQINGFRSSSDALSWLSEGQQEWLSKHPRNRNAGAT